MSPATLGPDPFLGNRRLSSRITAVGVVLLLITGILWLTYGFSNPVFDVGSYSTVHRDPYVDALTPEALAMSGMPSTATRAHPLPQQRSIRAIVVNPSYVELRAGGQITTTIKYPEASTLTLHDLVGIVGSPELLAEPTPGTFVLSAALVFRGTTGLDATGPPTVLHLTQGPSTFLAIDGRSVSHLDHVTVDVAGAPVGPHRDHQPRPFVLFDEGAAVHVANSSFRGLGWDANETLGLTWTRGATGSLRHSVSSHNFIGLYIQYVSSLVVDGNVISHNHLYGIDPHTYSSHLLIENNRTAFNGAHGIIAAVHVTHSRFLHNTSVGNGEHGIVMNEQSTSNLIEGNTASHNRGFGIVMTESPHTSLVGNVVEHNKIGILARNATPFGRFTGNTVLHNGLSTKGIPSGLGPNTIDTVATGFVLAPLGAWTWLIVWLLWPLVALVFLGAMIQRRRELRAGWREARAAAGLEPTAPPRSRAALWAGYREALSLRDARWAASHPLPASMSLAFEGPPPVRAPHVPAPAAAPERLLPSGDEIGTAPGDRRFRPDVQGLRALSVILVILYHYGLPGIPGGYVAVEVFFVVSGFVITGLLLRERSSTGTTSMGSFYARRARRILPAATFVIVATMVASYHWLGFIRGDVVAIDGRWASIFLANFHSIQTSTDYFGARDAVSPLLHYWSLAVEEQFYLFFPLFFVGLVTLVPRVSLRARLAIGLSVLIAASLVWSILQTGSNQVAAYYSPLTRAWELALGALIAVATPQLRRLPAAVAVALTWAGVGGILLAAIVYTSATPYPGIAIVLPVVATGAVIAGGLVASPRRGAEVVLGRRPALYIGEISFSLYLWHFPVLIIATQAVGHPLGWQAKVALCGVAVLLGIATYHFVENPVRHASGLVKRRGLSIGVGAVIIVISLVLSSVLINQHGAPAKVAAKGAASISQRDLTAKITEGAALSTLPSTLIPPLGVTTSANFIAGADQQGCLGIRVATVSVPNCFYGDPTATRTMVLLGDSQAEMWSVAMDKIARHDHWRLVVLAKEACPPWLITVETPSYAPYPECDAFHRFTTQRINALKPALVLVTGGFGANSSPANDARGLTRLFRALSPTKAEIDVLGNMPWFEGRWSGPVPPSCLAQHATSLKVCNLPYATFMASERQFRQALATTAIREGGRFINLDSLFCSTTTCPVVVDGHQVYFDAHHMLASYGAYVTPALRDLIGRRLLAPAP